MKKALIVTIFFAGVTLVPRAFAAESECDLKPQYKNLQDAVASNIYGSSEEVRRELSARADLLSSTIDCAVKELDNLKSQVSDAESDDNKDITSRLEGSLDEAKRFYAIHKDNIKDQGIEGTKGLAKDIRSYRNSTQIEIENRVANFLFWNNNQALFSKANDRLSQAKVVVASLKLLENDNAESQYNEAKQNLDHALDLNHRAGEALTKGLSSDDTLSLIKDSLSSLSSAYGSLVNIGEKLNKVLPTGEDKPEDAKQ